MTRWFLATVALNLLVLLSGCATYVTSTQATAFNQSISTAATNLQASLAEVQSIEVDNRVDEYARSDARRLEQLKADPKLTDAVSKSITSQFGLLVSYSASLKAATTPGTSWNASVTSLNSAATKVTADTGSLAHAMGDSTLLTPAIQQTVCADAGNVAKAVSTAGQALLTIYGDEKAYGIANATDTAVQKYCADLEALLGDNSDDGVPKSGLAGILHADYEEKIATTKSLATTALPPHGYDDPQYLQAVLLRRSIVDEYSTLLRNSPIRRGQDSRPPEGDRRHCRGPQGHGEQEWRHVLGEDRRGGGSSQDRVKERHRHRAWRESMTDVSLNS